MNMEIINNKVLSLNESTSLIKEIIDSQINCLYYSNCDFTRIHYLSVYEAFNSLLISHPEKIISYLIFLSRSENLQHKIFQTYISIFEKKIPFGFKKSGKSYKITSLLDENLCIFDGISNFNGIVNHKKEIKNNTQEFYIGGRSAAYAKPFYIGKLLDVINFKTKQSILTDVQEYSFSKICVKNTIPNTNVSVIHLRIPPHYQMGGMVYINRIRRKLVDEIYLSIKGIKREIKKQTFGGI